MAISLSQKVDDDFSGIWRWILGFAITDEIFALSMLEENVSRTYFFGLASISTAGWMLGTTLGAMLGSIVPTVISNALSIALYAMFIAIIIPGMKKDKNIIKENFTGDLKLENRNLYKIHGCIEKQDSLIFTVEQYFKAYGSKEFTRFLNKLFSKTVDRKSVV